MEKNIDVREIDIRALAYIGDSVYEVYIREHLLKNHNIQVSKLHKLAIKYVSAKAQAYVIDNIDIENNFSEDIQNIFKRGRNAMANTIPKNTDVITYKIATGFEAVVGYLYLENKKEKLDKFVFDAIEIIENGYIKN